MGSVYPWLTINSDGSQEIDMQGVTGVEKDRRLTIAQEIKAGRVVEAGVVRGHRDDVVLQRNRPRAV